MSSRHLPWPGDGFNPEIVTLENFTSTISAPLFPRVRAHRLYPFVIRLHLLFRPAETPVLWNIIFERILRRFYG
jgi:hypothetical protein